jgi:RNA polymerase sigma-70 factor (ECF subfamily)
MEAMNEFADLLRHVYPRVLARTLGLTRCLPDAEDAVQEAIARALETWPQRGRPESPVAWLVTVAHNAHRDRVRRSGREDLHEDALDLLERMSPWVRIAVGEPDVVRGWKDELLRLLFACCHPVLEPGESAALALSTIIGLSTKQVAAAFVVAPRTMEQRLTRARRRLRERGDCEGRATDDSRDRLEAVLQVIALLFNEGYWSIDDEVSGTEQGDGHDPPPTMGPIRAELCRLATGLAHSLLEAFPSEPEVAGLLALLQLHDARRGARLDERGVPVPLPRQDRRRWDRDAIASATRLLEQALRAAQPGPFQIEAAISAVHCRAASAETTDWREISALYTLLETLRPTPAVRVNRAFAVGRADGPAAGLVLLEPERGPDVSGHPYVHLVRGVLLEELGRLPQAREALAEASRHARNSAERAQIEERLAKLCSGPA